MGTIAITAISKTHFASITSISSDEIIHFDPFQPVFDEVPSLGEYFFIPKKKAIIKGRTQKRKMAQLGDTPPKKTVISDPSELDDKSFVGEVADSMGAFTQDNKCFVVNLKNIISQQKDKIKSFEKVLQQHKYLVEIDFQNHTNVIKK